MGANAQTTVPTFTTGQVLTAAQVNQINTGVPVFADSTARTAAFGGTGEKVLAQGQLSYLESDGKIYVYSGTAWVSISSVTNVAAFTTTTTWTVPTGVTYAIAHIRGAGGGIGLRDRNNPTVPAGDGGSSSVAFASGTITATGGSALNGNLQCSGVGIVANCVAGAVNSGKGAFSPNQGADATTGGLSPYYAIDGTYLVAGAAVTPGATITVTIGAGGTAGSGASTVGAAGGSGYVWITYES
jgi:hypothetical protein